MTTLQNVGLVEYAEEQRRHIAIIGKFTSERDNGDPVSFMTYRDAADKFKPKFYAVPEKTSVNEQHFYTVGLKTARLLPKEVDAIPMELSGPLDEALRSSKDSTEESVIGGELFVSLLNNLDALLPFMHPGFDTLLLEAFAEFADGELGGDGRRVSSREVNRTVKNAGVKGRFLAYLRADPHRAKEYFESFEQAMGDDKRWVGSLAKQFAEELRNIDGSEDGFRKFDSARTHHRNIRDKIHEEQIPGHRVDAATTVGSHLRHLFFEFHKARAAVQNVVNCEPALAMIVTWLFAKLGWSADGDGNDIVLANIQKAFFSHRAAAMTEDELKRFADGSRAFLQHPPEVEAGGDEAKSRIVATATAVVSRGLSRDFGEEVQRSYAFDVGQLQDELGALFDELIIEYIPGTARERAVAKVEVKAVAVAHRLYQDVRGQSLTVEDLERVFQEARFEEAGFEVRAKSIKEVGEMLAKLREAGQTGTDLQAQFDSLYTAVAGNVLKRNRDAIVRRAMEAGSEFILPMRKLFQKGLSEVCAWHKDRSVALAPPGGSVSVGGTTGGGMPGGMPVGMPVGPEGDSRAESSPASASAPMQEAAAGSVGSGDLRLGNSAPSRGPETESAITDVPGEPRGKAPREAPGGVPVRETTPDSEGNENSGFEGMAAAEFAKEELELTPSDIAKGAEGINEFYRELLGKQDLMRSTEQSENRARCRALLAGLYQLGAGPEYSPLNEQHRSLLCHFLLTMVKNLGRGHETDRKDLAGPNRIEWNEEKGTFRNREFADLDLGGVLEIGPAAEGAKALDNFITHWRTTAKQIKELPADMDDFHDVRDLLDALSRSGEDAGRVTIINETLAGYVKGISEPLKNRLIARTADSEKGKVPPGPPPGIVYVCRQAFEKDDNTPEKRGKRVWDAVFGEKGFCVKDGKDGPWSKNGESTAIQGLTEGFGEGCVWGMPIFIGRNLGQNRHNDGTGSGDHHVPRIGISSEKIGLAPGVLWLAGLSAARLGEFAGSAVAKLAGTGRMETLDAAWRALLGEDSALADQIYSRVVSLAMLERVRKAKKPQFKAILVASLADVIATHARTRDPRAREREERTLCKRLSVGKNRQFEDLPSLRQDPAPEVLAQLRVGSTELAMEETVFKKL